MSKKRRTKKPKTIEDQQAIELPKRRAMSLISGVPSLGGGGLLGGSLFGGSSTTPTSPTAPALPSDPSATPTANPGDVSTIAPSNQETLLNQLSSGATQSGTASQTAPVTQSG